MGRRNLVFVGYETHFLCSDETKAAFLDAPWEYAGKVTDPVSRGRFSPSSVSPRRDRAERIFFFESAETAARFDTDPAAYETPMIAMVPKKE